MLKVKSKYNSDFYLETEVVDYRYKKIESGEVIHSSSDGKLERFVKDTSEEGVFEYGAIQLTDSWDHKAGYIWSSRCSVMNQIFGTRLVEVVINSRSYAMDVDVLKTIAERDLSQKFEVVKYTDKEGEISYRLVEHEQ